MKTHTMKTLLMSLAFCILGIGCASTTNTKDVTKIVVTQTGVIIGQSSVDKTPQLTLGRNQVEYIKVPTGLNATNAGAQDVSILPAVVSAYEANGNSLVFGRAAITSTLATHTNGVSTLLGGQHEPINISTGTNAIQFKK